MIVIFEPPVFIRVKSTPFLQPGKISISSRSRAYGDRNLFSSQNYPLW
jgi:hypothetical protein